MKIIKRITALVLCACMLMLCACSNAGDGVINYKSAGKTLYSFDSGFVYFWISLQKSMYTSVAEVYENGWDEVIDEKQGTTLSDLLITESRESAKKLIAIEYLHDTEYKLTLSDEQKDVVENQISSLKKSAGSQSNFDSVLSKYGADENTLRRYYGLMLKQTNLYERFYGENGMYSIPDESKKQYFKENYYAADHIFFAYPEKGESEEEKARHLALCEEIKATATAVYQAVKNAGEDFDAMKELHNQDGAAEKYYPHGFFVTNDSAFPVGFTSAVMSIEAGEVTLVETPDVGMHIIRGLELNPSYYNAYDDVLSNITEALCAEDFGARIGAYTSNVFVDEAAFGSYDPALIPAFAF